MSAALRPPPAVLVVAGSDPLGHSGLQADLRHLAAVGCTACAVPSCLTEQTREGPLRVLPVPAEHLEAALRLVLASDAETCPAAIKIGLLHDAATVAAVGRALAAAAVPLVLDPVLAAGAGGGLCKPDCAGALLEHLVPLAALVTPNLPELATLAGGAGGVAEQAGELLAAGAERVLVKGGHGSRGGPVTDLLVDAQGLQAFESEPWPGPAPRGTGCALSTWIAAGLATGLDPVRAVGEARTRLDAAARRAIARGSRRL